MKDRHDRREDGHTRTRGWKDRRGKDGREQPWAFEKVSTGRGRFGGSWGAGWGPRDPGTCWRVTASSWSVGVLMKWRVFVGTRLSSVQSPKACLGAALPRPPLHAPQCLLTPAGPLRPGSGPPEACCPCCHLTGTWPWPALLPLTAHFQVTVPSKPRAPRPQNLVRPPRGRRGNTADPHH